MFLLRIKTDHRITIYLTVYFTKHFYFTVEKKTLNKNKVGGKKNRILVAGSHVSAKKSLYKFLSEGKIKSDFKNIAT